jgi:hypothetical protein
MLKARFACPGAHIGVLRVTDINLRIADYDVWMPAGAFLPDWAKNRTIQNLERASGAPAVGVVSKHLFGVRRTETSQIKLWTPEETYYGKNDESGIRR